MIQNHLCIVIPEELQVYTKAVALVDSVDAKKTNNFGVNQIKDEAGNLIGVAYYSSSGELIKRVYYKGSSISKIDYFRNDVLFSSEEFETGKILTKTLFNSDNEKICVIKYSYNCNNDVVSIQKSIEKLVYKVEYRYDELHRVNCRIIKVGGNIINEQKYRYDILDRIVEYSDNNQKIKVHKVNPYNNLVSYTITDVLGNKIEINNKFLCSEYIGTEIEINGHKTSVNDKMYIDNIVLKKPYTNEDDLDFALSNLTKISKIRSAGMMSTKRNTDIYTDKISTFVISNKKEKENFKPISAANIKLLKF